MLIALAAILATLLTGCASEYQTPVTSSNQLMTSLSPQYPPTTTPLFVGVASATATVLKSTPFLSHHSKPTPPTSSGKVVIYIIQFHQPLDTAQRTQFLAELEQRLGRPVAVIYHYTVAYQGLALQLTTQEASTVATMPQVKHLQPDSPRYSQPSSSHHRDSTQTE